MYRKPPVAPRTPRMSIADPQGAVDHSLRTTDIDSSPKTTQPSINTS